MIKNNFMEKKEYDNADKANVNIFLKMPLAFALLGSGICVLIGLIFLNPYAYSDALDFCANGIADNVHVFGLDINDSAPVKNIDLSFAQETIDKIKEKFFGDKGTVEIEEVAEAEEIAETEESEPEEIRPPLPDDYDGTSAGVAIALFGENGFLGPDVVVGAAAEETEVEETPVEEELVEEEPEEEIIDENVYMVPYVPYDEYTPKEVDSRYFSDLGRTPHSMTAEYVVADDDYFEDSCWIGDSRTVGIADYSGWSGADFYCDNGFCAYEYSIGKAVHLQGKGGKRTIEEAMDLKQYGKVYIMFGINDTGYGTTTMFKENYQNLINLIKEKQPNAIIYIVGNMHISEEADAKAKNGALTNLNINAKNVAASELADGITTFYIDFNESFTDDNGFLIDSKTFDGYHLYADGYMELVEFFKEHTVVPPSEEMELRYSEEALAPIVGQVDNEE